MIPSKKKNPEHEKSLSPVEEAKHEAEEGIAEDLDFSSDPASDDLDEGELANFDNSSDNDI
jgi:hypothetical protein